MEMFMSLKVFNPGQYLSQLLVDVCYSAFIIVTIISTITADTTSTNTNWVEFSGLYQVQIISTFLNVIFSTIDTTSSCSRPYCISTAWLTAFAPFGPLICITTLTILRCLLFQLIAASRTSWLEIFIFLTSSWCQFQFTWVHCLILVWIFWQVLPSWRQVPHSLHADNSHFWTFLLVVVKLKLKPPPAFRQSIPSLFGPHCLFSFVGAAWFDCVSSATKIHKFWCLTISVIFFIKIQKLKWMKLSLFVDSLNNEEERFKFQLRKWLMYQDNWRHFINVQNWTRMNVTFSRNGCLLRFCKRFIFNSNMYWVLSKGCESCFGGQF